MVPQMYALREAPEYQGSFYASNTQHVCTPRQRRSRHFRGHNHYGNALPCHLDDLFFSVLVVVHPVEFIATYPTVGLKGNSI